MVQLTLRSTYAIGEEPRVVISHTMVLVYNFPSYAGHRPSRMVENQCIDCKAIKKKKNQTEESKREMTYRTSGVPESVNMRS